MPLSQYDPNLDYDGSWAVASANWCYISFGSKEAAEQAYTVCWKQARVPYGSYVLVDKMLRLEQERYRRSVANYLTMLGIPFERG